MGEVQVSQQTWWIEYSTAMSGHNRLQALDSVTTVELMELLVHVLGARA